MTAKVLVKNLTFNDGTAVTFGDSGVILIVGPNNAGKSQILRDISAATNNPPTPGVVATVVTVEASGSGDELLEKFVRDRVTFGSDQVDIQRAGQIQLGTALTWWSTPNNRVLFPYFFLTANTESRLEASKPSGSMNLYESRPTHPLHFLYMTPSIADRLAEISLSAFAQGLILDTWAGGAAWSLRVGELAPPSSPRPDQDYLDELQKLPLLKDQGDGVRSMVGLLLNLFTGHQTVSLIDEPEAFLHPPQARYLAKLLSEDAQSSNRMTFLSTHSADIVHGTLEGPATTTVIRIVRDGDTNSASILDNDAVRRLWSDPLLRYSNLLEGLFTDAVVVCESDADCKFFAAVRDTLPPSDAGGRRADLLFTSCGGKHRMHVAVQALRAASVPVAVIGDFDVLNDWSVVERLVASAGGEPSELEGDWRVLNAALTSNSRTPSVVGMREAVLRAFDSMTSVTPKGLERVREALKIESGWDRAKKEGLAAVPSGEPHKAAKRLLSALADLNIHLVPVGEMENFVPSVGGHGPAWVSEVLEKRLHEKAETDQARIFFDSLSTSLSGAA